MSATIGPTAGVDINKDGFPDIVALVKPQFEAGRSHVKKGIVRDPLVHTAVCDVIASFVASRGWHLHGIFPSPISGGDGNREFFIGAHRT